MENLQEHTHLDDCCRKKKCHFGFPKPPTEHTVISQQLLDDDDDKTTSMTVKDTIELLKSVQNIYCQLKSQWASMSH